MFSKDTAKFATAALAAAACVFVMSSVRAAGWNDDQPGATTYFYPVSAPCHPSIDRGACLKQAKRGAGGGAGDAMTLAQNGAAGSDPVSAPCHPALYQGACLKR
jgi:hypothetical protein